MRAGRQVWGLNEQHECRMVVHAACTKGGQSGEVKSGALRNCAMYDGGCRLYLAAAVS